MSAAAEVTALLLSHHGQAGGFHSKPRSASPRGAGAPSAVSSRETQLKLGHRWCCGCPKSLAVPSAQSPSSVVQRRRKAMPTYPVRRRQREAAFLRRVALRRWQSEGRRQEVARVQALLRDPQQEVPRGSLHTARTPAEPSLLSRPSTASASPL